MSMVDIFWFHYFLDGALSWLGAIDGTYGE